MKATKNIPTSNSLFLVQNNKQPEKSILTEQITKTIEEERKIYTPQEKTEPIFYLPIKINKDVKRSDSFLELYIQRVVIAKKIVKREKLPMVIQASREQNSLRKKIVESIPKNTKDLENKARKKILNETEIIGRPIWNKRVEKCGKNSTQPSNRRSLITTEGIKKPRRILPLILKRKKRRAQVSEPEVIIHPKPRPIGAPPECYYVLLS